ncbi:MAG TPA: hypothetical protein VIH60_01775 [Steroidobacteraceae bacterium]|jgi:hypothetical protein
MIGPTRPALLLIATAIAMSAAAVAAADSFDSREESFRSALVSHGVNATDPDHAGIWKAATPPLGSMRGEFESNDPIGLSAGVRIKADCSINWVDPDSGKLYCFSSATSLVVFLDTPHSYLARAMKNWDATQAAVRSGAVDPR